MGKSPNTTPRSSWHPCFLNSIPPALLVRSFHIHGFNQLGVKHVQRGEKPSGLLSVSKQDTEQLYEEYKQYRVDLRHTGKCAWVVSKCYSILYKGLVHPQIVVSTRGAGTNPLWTSTILYSCLAIRQSYCNKKRRQEEPIGNNIDPEWVVTAEALITKTIFLTMPRCHFLSPPPSLARTPANFPKDTGQVRWQQSVYSYEIPTSYPARDLKNNASFLASFCKGRRGKHRTFFFLLKS